MSLISHAKRQTSTNNNKSKINLSWNGRSYTQNDTWYYLNSSYGSSYHLMHTNYSRTTLGDFANSLPANTYPAGKNSGFTSPIDGIIKSITFSFHCVSSTYVGTFQFGLIHGTINTETTSSTVPTTNINIGGNGESATGNDTALEITTTTAQHRHIVSKENINHSVKKGDMIMLGCRRTTDTSDSTVHQLNFSVNIIIEEE